MMVANEPRRKEAHEERAREKHRVVAKSIQGM